MTRKYTPRERENRVSFNTVDCWHKNKAKLYANMLWDAIQVLQDIDGDIKFVKIHKLGSNIGLKPGQIRLGITMLLRNGNIEKIGRKYYEIINGT